VQDAVDLIYLLSKSSAGFEIFNGGSGNRMTVKEILCMLSHEIGLSVEILMGNENKQGDPRHYWADITRLQKLGWAPQHKIKAGLREYVEWFRCYGPRL
jgi:nucleoside-diphosphate-sugar epimerase